MNKSIDENGLSRQQLKSQRTKARIFQAAKTILQKRGYEAVSYTHLILKYLLYCS